MSEIGKSLADGGSPLAMSDELRERITEALLTPGLSVDRVTDLVDEIAGSVIVAAQAEVTVMREIIAWLRSGLVADVENGVWQRLVDGRGAGCFTMTPEQVAWFTEHGSEDR